MNALKFLKTVIVYSCLFLFSGQASEKKPMNVLFLAIDDLNTWLLSEPHRYGGKVATPNIKKLADEGIGVDLIDPRTVVPLDREAIFSSVRRTGRLVVVDEARDMCSAASHIAAVCADQCFEDLKAPIKRVTVPDLALPYSPPLEKALLPNEGCISAAVMDVLGKAAKQEA